ncbi:MAG: hypothetical protein WAW60_03350 [Candidatus Saccharimonadales bacterium]
MPHDHHCESSDGQRETKLAELGHDPNRSSDQEDDEGKCRHRRSHPFDV